MQVPGDRRGSQSTPLPRHRLRRLLRDSSVVARTGSTSLSPRVGWAAPAVAGEGSFPATVNICIVVIVTLLLPRVRVIFQFLVGTRYVTLTSLTIPFLLAPFPSSFRFFIIPLVLAIIVALAVIDLPRLIFVVHIVIDIVLRIHLVRFFLCS